MTEGDEGEGEYHSWEQAKAGQSMRRSSVEWKDDEKKKKRMMLCKK